MRFRITHITQYDYAEPVTLCQNEAHLLPRSVNTQQCLDSEMVIEPSTTTQREREDYFGNRVSYFSIERPHRRLRITVTSDVETLPQPLFNDADELSWEEARAQIITANKAAALEARQYGLTSPMIPFGQELAEYGAPSFRRGRALSEAVEDLMHRIYHDFAYDPHFTTIATPLDEVLRHRRGVCQDFAHLAIGCVRARGLPARYVSGYIETLPPPGQPRLVGADASHAWFAIYHPTRGWLDFDPTNNKMAGEQHITVAWGRDYADVPPLKGVVFGGGQNELTVSVDVARQPPAEQRSELASSELTNRAESTASASEGRTDMATDAVSVTPAAVATDPSSPLGEINASEPDD